MDASISHDGSEAVLALDGDFDLARAGQLRSDGQAALERAQRDGTRLILDLAGVAFMDSMALGAVVTLRNDADRANIRFAVRNLQPQVTRLLELTRLTEYLGVEQVSDPVRPPGGAA